MTAQTDQITQATRPRAAAAARHVDQRPRLLFFHSRSSGRSQRVDAFLAQVLQRRHNHDTFKLTRISVDERPDLAERFQVDTVPTLLVVEHGRIVRRIISPRGCKHLEECLRPWLH